MACQICLQQFRHSIEHRIARSKARYEAEFIDGFSDQIRLLCKILNDHEMTIYNSLLEEIERAQNVEIDL